MDSTFERPLCDYGKSNSKMSAFTGWLIWYLQGPQGDSATSSRRNSCKLSIGHRHPPFLCEVRKRVSRNIVVIEMSLALTNGKAFHLKIEKPCGRRAFSVLEVRIFVFYSWGLDFCILFVRFGFLYLCMAGSFWDGWTFHNLLFFMLLLLPLLIPLILFLLLLLLLLLLLYHY